jgi:O6-methylguanine-DNA--protein-cysteine methyltransferase
MDFIKKRAENFAKQHIVNQVDEHETVVDEAQMELNKIIKPLDKITFLRVILEVNERQYQSHLLVCKNKNNCPENDSHEAIHYYLTCELEDLGIQLNEDQFTKEEQFTAESKLDQVLKELETVKLGHQVIYKDLMKEL